MLVALQEDIDNFAQAARGNDLETLHALYETYGSTILNERDEHGSTALCGAVDDNEQPDAFDFLLRVGADIHQTDKNGNTPLIHATTGNKEDRARELLLRGARPADKNDLGWTALHLASGLGYANLVALLIEAGADVNAQSESGYTPLMAAAEQKCVESVLLLLESGANPSLPHRNGTKAIDIARRNKLEQITLLLQREEDTPGITRQLRQEHTLIYQGVPLPAAKNVPLKLRPPSQTARKP